MADAASRLAMSSIHLRGSVTSDTFLALERISINYQWPDLHDWEEPELLAWLSFKLQHVPDTKENFPFGKWATIQRLQALLSEYAFNVTGNTAGQA